MGKGRRIRGRSYAHRVREINRIYREHANSGLSNREILRRFIYPVYHISESTLYNILGAEFDVEEKYKEDPLLFEFDENGKPKSK